MNKDDKSELQEQINDLEKEESRLLSILGGVRSSKNQLLMKLWKIENGLEMGDDVSFKNGRERKVGKLTDLKIKYERVSPIVTHYKKDGSLGIRTTDYFYGKITKIAGMY